MTRLPIESRLAVDRPDLPEYEINKACPVTGEVTGLENHHVWRRSAGYPSWWVELPDGTVVGNRINLSSAAHYRLTVNKARIVYEDGVFYWDEAGEKIPLRWQPPKIDVVALDVGMTVQDTEGVWVNADISPSPEFSGEIPPGEECPSCHRRIPHPKKKSSPQTRVFSTRVPIDDADTFKDLVDAAAEHMGIKERPHHVYNVLLTGVTLVLQSPKEHLPGG